MSDDFKAYPVRGGEMKGTCVPGSVTLELSGTKDNYCSETLLASRSRCSFCGARRRAFMNQLLTYNCVSIVFEREVRPK